MSITENIHKIKDTLTETVTLVAVSKTKPNDAILEAYQTGQRIFGENKVQELVQKYEDLPKDIEWHLIGHLQTNKVKYIAPFVNLIHAVDSLKLLKEISKQAIHNNKTINCLLQVKIAEEESKYGLSIPEVEEIMSSDEVKKLKGIKIVGLMGMATFTDNRTQIQNEFATLKTFFDQLITQHPLLTTLSMGMSGDYQIAIEQGSTMVRIGSTIFGERNYN